MSDIGTFDSLNFVPPRGSTPLGLGLIYDTLMVSSMDEVSTEYGLLADAVKYPGGLLVGDLSPARGANGMTASRSPLMTSSSPSTCSRSTIRSRPTITSTS